MRRGRPPRRACWRRKAHGGGWKIRCRTCTCAARRAAGLGHAEGAHELPQPARPARIRARHRRPGRALAAELRSGSPFDGSDPSVSSYGEEGASADALADACIDATKRAITHALSLGFRKQDIAVLSYRGREGSVRAARPARPAPAQELHRQVRPVRQPGVSRRRRAARFDLPLQGPVGAVRDPHRGRLRHARRACRAQAVRRRDACDDEAADRRVVARAAQLAAV